MAFSIPPVTPRTETILSIIAYSMCSGTLVLINKVILHMLPYPSLVISFQLVAAITMIYGGTFAGLIDCDGLQWKYILPYLAYTAAFAIGVFCNMKSLQHSNVETVIIFRALAPCIVAVLDVMFLGREYPATRSWMGLSLIVLGAYGYAMTDSQFENQGYSAYFWPTLYCAVISFEMAYGKKIIRTVDLKTKSGPVLYTNLLSLPATLLFAGMGHEYNKFWKDFWEREGTRFPPGSVALLLVGCVIGTAIGYSSWWCRDRVSATSFTLIGVMNKCFTVLLNMLIWDNHATPLGMAALGLCLVGGMMYKQSPMRAGAQRSNSRIELLLPKGGDDDIWDTEVNSEASALEINEELLSAEAAPDSGNAKRRHD